MQTLQDQDRYIQKGVENQVRILSYPDLYKLKIFGSIIIFILGLTIGWYLREFSTDGRTTTVIQQDQKSTSSSLVVTPSVNIAPALDRITVLFEQANHGEILRLFQAAYNSGSNEYPHLLNLLIHYLQQAVQRGQSESVQDLLTGAREILPDDPGLLYISAESAQASEDYLTAITLFYELRDSRQELFSDQQINQQLGLLVDAYRHRLIEQKQTDRLLRLYQLVTSRDPTRPEFFYQLAKTQYELRNLEQARSSLSYVLNDMVWGRRAQGLLAQIERIEMLQSKYHSQIPLSRSGRHFLLTGMINGVHEVTLLLDTGASYTTLTPEFLVELGLNETESSPVMLETGGGPIRAKLYNVATLSVGDQIITNAVIAGVPLGPNTKADGLLGMNFLSNFEFFIDQEEAVLYLKTYTH